MRKFSVTEVCKYLVYLYSFFLSLLEVPQIFVLIKNNFVRHDTKTASGSQSDLAIESTQSSEAKTFFRRELQPFLVGL